MRPGRARAAGPPAARERLGGAFWRFWSVEVATDTGIGLAVIALQTMVVLDLGGGATEVGWLSSARWLPYAVLGLLVGAIVEGMRRRSVMIVSDLVRAHPQPGQELPGVSSITRRWSPQRSSSPLNSVAVRLRSERRCGGASLSRSWES